MAQLEKLLRGIWAFLREVSGENDYPRYRARALAGGEPPLSPQEFYAEELRRKYSRPHRCC